MAIQSKTRIKSIETGVAGDKPISPQTESTSAISSLEDTGASRSGNLQFPADYGQKFGQWLIITEYKYSRPSLQGRVKNRPTGLTISLPLPSNMPVAYSTNWENLDLGLYGHKFINGIESAMTASKYGELYNTGIEAVKKQFNNAKEGKLGEIADAIFSGTGDIASGAGNFAAAAAVDAFADTTLGKTASAATGVARNPYHAAVFNGVDFRGFDFSYDFIPKNEKEARTLRDIIKKLKSGMMPYLPKEQKGTTKNLLLQYPYLYKISFTNDNYLFKIGFCTLRNFSIDYHGLGRPVYFENDGSTPEIPVSYKLALSFTEIDALTRNKIEDEGR